MTDWKLIEEILLKKKLIIEHSKRNKEVEHSKRNKEVEVFAFSQTLNFVTMWTKKCQAVLCARD